MERDHDGEGQQRVPGCCMHGQRHPWGHGTSSSSRDGPLTTPNPLHTQMHKAQYKLPGHWFILDKAFLSFNAYNSSSPQFGVGEFQKKMPMGHIQYAKQR